MNLTLLGVIPWWAQVGAVFFIIICILLIVIVLLQKGKGGGLSAAFGGAGGQTAFGGKTGDVFTWATIVIVGIFLLMAMFLTMKYTPVLENAEPMGAPPLGAAQPQLPGPGASDTGPETDAQPSWPGPGEAPTGADEPDTTPPPENTDTAAQDTGSGDDVETPETSSGETD